MPSKVKQSKRDEIARRRVQVSALRLSHLTQPEIAERLGVSIGTVNSDLQAIRKEWAERRSIGYEAWLEEELAKLDRLERSLMPLALQGKAHVADRILSIMDRRSRMLGLDQPSRHEHTVITRDAIDAEIERLEAEMADADA